MHEIPEKFLKEELKAMKNRTATGRDKLNTELLKYGGMMLLWILLHIINEC